MKSSNIPENTQGNKEGLVQWVNDHYADNQPWVFLGPGKGENRSYPCTLHQFEVQGLYIDLKLATDKHGFNVLGVQPWHFYEKGEYRDAMEWLVNNRKPSKIVTVLLSLGGFGFFNNTSPEDVTYVLSQSEELHVIVSGPPADHKAYRTDVIKAVATSGKPVYIYSSADDHDFTMVNAVRTGTNSGTSCAYSQTLHDQLKAEGANVTLTMYSPGFGHNGTATHVWKTSEFYKWAAVPQSAPVPVPQPAPVPDPVVTPPVVAPPNIVPPKKTVLGQNLYVEKVRIQTVYTDGSTEYEKETPADPVTIIWIEKPKKITLVRKSGTTELKK